MELTGELKKQVEQAKDKTEAKEMIAKAGMQLTDEELDQVAGGKKIHFRNAQITGEYTHESFQKTKYLCYRSDTGGAYMKFTDELKKKIDTAASEKEVKDILENVKGGRRPQA